MQEKFNMSCNKFDQFGILYLYDELNQADKEKYENHLQKCNFCEKSITQLDETKNISSNIADFFPSQKSLLKIKFIARKQLFINQIQSFVEILKLRNKLMPSIVAVGIIIVILFTLIKQWDSQQNTLQNSHLAWSNGTDAAIDSLNQEIDLVYSQLFSSLKNFSITDSTNPLDGLTLHELNPKKLDQDINLLSSNYKLLIF